MLRRIASHECGNLGALACSNSSLNRIGERLSAMGSLEALEPSPFLGPVRSIWGERMGTQQTSTPHESFYDSTVQEYAMMPIHVMSLKQMLEFGFKAKDSQEQLLTSAKMVQKELPRRLARRLMDLQLLPYIVVANPHIRRVYDAYYNAFQTLRLHPPVEDLEANAEFTKLLKRLVDEHAPMLDSLAHGLRECATKPIIGSRLSLDDFFDTMLRSRISRRVIAEQHISLANPSSTHIGLIDTELSLYNAVDFAVQRTRQVCTETYGLAPDIIVSGDVRAVMPYIPIHLDYMLYELLKNAARAVIERKTKGRRRGSLPPIQVAICEGPHDVTIRISDKGGGIPESSMHRVWQYGYTTTRNINDEVPEKEWLGFGRTMTDAADAGRRRFRMSGLGFGLPLSRVYARYFDGDLHLKTLPGYGVDAFLMLKRLKDHDWMEHPEEYSGDHVIVDNRNVPSGSAVVSRD